MKKICFENVKKKYGKTVVLNNLNLQIDLNNRIISLLGPNGAGKTTLMKLLSGILFFDSGNISLNDDVNSQIAEGKSYIQWANKNIAYLSPDERYLSFKNTAQNNIIYYSALKGISREIVNSNIIKFANLLDCVQILDRRIEELSTGQKKIVKLLSVFCTGLPVLLLDEPTLGLDVDMKEKLIQCILLLKENADCTVLISSHDLDFVSRVTNKHYFIFQGEIKVIAEKQIDFSKLMALYKEVRGEYDDKKIL